MTQTAFHGTEQERADLLVAIARNCDCDIDMVGVLVNTCSLHQALVHSQRFLDGMVWGRRIRERLRREEFSTTARS